MPWSSGTYTRSDGTRTGSTVFEQARSANVRPSATLFDNEANDTATGLNNCLTKDGQNTPTGNLPMGNNKHTGCADGTARTEYATKGQLDDAMGIDVAAADVADTGTTATLTPTPAVTALTRGMRFNWVAETENTGAVDVTINSLAAVNLLKNGTEELGAGDIPVGHAVETFYDGARLQLLNPAVRIDLGDVSTFDALSQTDYDALTPNATTLYLITS